jgi:hypothetical protein
MVHDSVNKEWKSWVVGHMATEYDGKKGKNKFSIMTIKDLENIKEKFSNVMMICRTAKDRMDVKNRIFEAQSKGGEYKTEPGRSKDDYNFIDFFAEDETSIVMCRMSHDIYPDYKAEMELVKPGDAILVIGRCSDDILIVFVQHFINLTNLKKKLDEGSELTDKERSFIKKGIL